MQVSDLRRLLDDLGQARSFLASWALADLPQAHRNLVRMAEGGVPLDLLADICGQLTASLPSLSDPDMALNNLERFVAAARSPLALAAAVRARPRRRLPCLLQIFSTSQHLSDLLITDSESYDLLRLTEGQPVARETLVSELCAEVAALSRRVGS